MFDLHPYLTSHRQLKHEDCEYSPRPSPRADILWLRNYDVKLSWKALIFLYAVILFHVLIKLGIASISLRDAMRLRRIYTS